MPIPTLLLSPDGSRDRNGSVTPTLTGGVIEVPGQYGDAWQVAEATTNLALDPAFVGRTPPNVGWTLSRSTTPAPAISGNTFAATWNPGAAMVLYSLEDFSYAPSSGLSYTASMYIHTANPSAGKNVRLRFGTRGGTVSAYSAWVPIPSVPTRISVTLTTVTGTTSMFVNAEFQGLAAGDTIYVSNKQIEEKPYATPYADGSLGAGHAWTGTPHASSSTRSLGTVRHTLEEGQVNNPEGTMLARFHIPERSASGWERIAALGIWSNSFLSIGREGNRLRSYNHGTAGSTPVSLFGPNISAGWHTASISWGGFGRRLSLNGVVVAESPIAPDYEFVGKVVESGFSGQSPAGPIEAIMVFDTVLSDAEIERISAMPEAWTWDALLPKLGGIHVGYKPDTLGVALSSPLDPLAVARTIRTE